MNLSDLRVAFHKNKHMKKGIFSTPTTSILQTTLKSLLKDYPRGDRALTMNEEFELSQALFRVEPVSPTELNVMLDLREKLWGKNAENIFLALRIIYSFDGLAPDHWPQRREHILQERRISLIAAYLMISLPHARETASFIDFIKTPGLDLELIYTSLRQLHDQNKLNAETLTQLRGYQVQMHCRP